ncbi:MAG: ATP-dependent DNA helicase [Candidatus Paceibacterota bacterium]
MTNPKTSTKFDESYAKLNPAQRRAVDAIDGPVMVVAGPGSGKTEILSLRVANILRRTDMSPGNILCLTFTDSASVNMRKRLVGMIGNAAYRVSIHTFHSFGVEIINSYPEYFFGGASLLPADDLATIRILENIFSELPHDNPLSSVFEDSFTYLRDAKSAITHLKKGGLDPDEFRAALASNAKFFEFANPLVSQTLSERLSKKIFPAVAALLEKLQSCQAENLEGIHPIHMLVSETLSRALSRSESLESTVPLSEWKKEWTEKNDDGETVLKGTAAQVKLFTLADVYEKYQDAMRKEGYYDFDDMILDVIHSLAKNEALRYELQERYQYLLVDEFQDTNDAQMRLIRLLSDLAVHEGRPNIMVVGDDDQAIYKFQGAEISNILSFREMYRDPVIITMTDNYRSTQSVLDLARHIILKGDERLENRIPEMEKKLTAGNKNIPEGAIVRKSFHTRLDEFCFIADEIKKAMALGKSANDIAIICRKHSELESIVPFLHRKAVPVRYDRKQNVFREPHVRELILLSRFVSSLGRKHQDEADELLPEILAFPFWRIPRKVSWQISRDAKRGRWLDAMSEHLDGRVREVADFLIDLGERSKNETLEQILDDLMGSDIIAVAFDDDEQQATSSKQQGNRETNKFVSPFKEYYFSREKFKENKSEFLLFLSSLRVFVEALREYKQGTMLRIDDLVEFVDLHESNKIPVVDTSPFVSASESVTLLSAHKAKGLEFDTVFTISCQNDIWAGRGMSSKLPFPKNLGLAPAGDTLDDQLRLFYVALTRAKSHLYLTSYEIREDGKETLPLEFLTLPDQGECGENVREMLAAEKHEAEVSEESERTTLFEAWKSFLAPPFVADEQALLHSLLDEYQMSVTHFNNFLDVSRGGPQTFLEHNLLRFPEAKSPSGAYGSAIHSALEKTYTYLKREGKIPDTKTILAWFEEQLRFGRLSLRDHEFFLKKGNDALGAYLKEKGGSFDPLHKIETDFKNQGVLISDARLTGKIDKMIPEGDGKFLVVDLKTGKSFDEWEGKSADEKIKLYKYRRQLVFYKLLVENSRDFSKYLVEEGTLEFVEPDKKGKVRELRALITEQETDRTKALIEAVYKKIMALDFPDVSKYSKDIAGMMNFEADLLSE